MAKKKAPGNFHTTHRKKTSHHELAVNVTAQVAEVDAEINTLNTLYDNYRRRFFQLRLAEPHSPRLVTLNIVLNKLALAVTDCQKERNRLQAESRNCFYARSVLTTAVK